MRNSILFRGVRASILTMVVILIMGSSLINATELRPGVVIDPASQVVFIAMPDGGIEAIDIQAGNVLWTSASADMPVAVHDGRLIARVEAESPGRLILKSLDIRNGALLHSSEAALPNDVHALIDERLGERFQERTDLDETSLFVTWRYSYQLITGPKPEREQAPQISTGTFGRWNVDMEYRKPGSERSGELQYRGNSQRRCCGLDHQFRHVCRKRERPQHR